MFAYVESIQNLKDLKTPSESGLDFPIRFKFARFSYERLYDWTASSELRLADLEMPVQGHGVCQGSKKGEGYMVFYEAGQHSLTACCQSMLSADAVESKLRTTLGTVCVLVLE